MLDFTDEPAYWFMRWKVEISQADIETFKERFLNPILEQVCDWWSHIEESHKRGIEPFCSNLAHDTLNTIHYQHPFGVRSMIDEKGVSDYDSYLQDGNTVGLRRVDALFGEL
jgi:hypothetical protein